MKLLDKTRTRSGRARKHLRGRCPDVKSTKLEGGKAAPPGNRGPCERGSKSPGSE